MISAIVQKDYNEIMRYINEIEEDNQLWEHFRKQIGNNPYLKSYYGNKMLIGRRAGWYAVVRALKPKVVIETGVATGIGACVVSAALMKNTEEGCGGHYYGAEIDRSQCVLFKEPYTKFGTILWGDSLDSLKDLTMKL